MYKLWLNTTYHANYETQWSWLWLIAYKLCNHKVRCGEIFFLFEINPLQLGILTHLYGHIQKKNGWITLDIVQKTKSGLMSCSLWLRPNELEKNVSNLNVIRVITVGHVQIGDSLQAQIKLIKHSLCPLKSWD